MKFSMNDSLAAVEMCKKWKLGLNAAPSKKLGSGDGKEQNVLQNAAKKVSFVSYPWRMRLSPFLSDIFT